VATAYQCKHGLEAASEMHPEWQGPPPFKNQFRGHFDPNFSNTLDWGTKITLKIF